MNHVFALLFSLGISLQYILHHGEDLNSRMFPVQLEDLRYNSKATKPNFEVEACSIPLHNLCSSLNMINSKHSSQFCSSGKAKRAMD
jgi:hypothetical protein